MASTVPLSTPPLPADDTPAARQQRRTDANHLRALSVFHYLLALFAAAIAGYTVHGLIRTRQIIADMPPEAMRQMGGINGALFGVAIVFGVGALANAASGWCMVRRRAWVFSLVVAGLDLFYFPIGTALAVCTLILLLRGSVGESYGCRAA